MGELRFLAAVFLLVLIGVLMWRAWQLFLERALAEEGRQIVKSHLSVKEVIKRADKNRRLGSALWALLAALAAGAVALLFLT